MLSSDFIFLSSNRVGLTCIMQVQIFALLVFTQILSILKRRCQLQLTVNIWPMGVSRGFRVQTPRNESVPEIRYKNIKISRQSMGMEIPKPRNVFLATPLVWPVRLGKCRAYSVKYCTLCDLSVPWHTLGVWPRFLKTKFRIRFWPFSAFSVHVHVGYQACHWYM